MSDRLACIILDALGPYNVRKLGLDYIDSLYKSENYCSGLMGISGLAHTPISNALMWGNYHNDDNIWVMFNEHEWAGGIDGFDPIKQVKEENATFINRSHYDTDFVWDILDDAGVPSCALGIPITLPPYSYNAKDRLKDSWFPHTEPMLKKHLRRKPEIIKKHIGEYDFICSSIKVPDQWLHGMGSDMCSEEFIESEVPVLEQTVQELITELESEGYDWLIFGDHGSPITGRTANHKKKKLCARHRKEAMIIGSTDTIPKYSHEMYPFILSYFGVPDTETKTPKIHRFMKQLERDRYVTDRVNGHIEI